MKIVDLIEEVEFSEDSITITSRTTTTSPNQLLKTVTAKLIAQSEKAVIFVTPDYMKDDVTKFEFELIKLKPSETHMLANRASPRARWQLESLCAGVYYGAVSQSTHL